MKTILKIEVFIACCILILSSFAQPNIENDSLILKNTYKYCYGIEYLNGRPGNRVFPDKYSGETYSIADGSTGFIATKLENKWNSIIFTKNRKPATSVICINMVEHNFTAQFYEGAPHQYVAIVLGADGNFYNVSSFFCELLSSQEYRCLGLPVSDTQKNIEDGISYYTIDVQTDSCYGNNIITLYYFQSMIIPSSLKDKIDIIDDGGRIYMKGKKNR